MFYLFSNKFSIFLFSLNKYLFFFFLLINLYTLPYFSSRIKVGHFEIEAQFVVFISMLISIVVLNYNTFI